MGQICFLVAGPGLIGKKHIELIQSRDNVRLAALVGPGTDENIHVSERCGVPIYETIAEALAGGGVDAAIISSPNTCHFEQAMTCLAQGVPVLVEKPVTNRLDEAKLLMLKADELDVPVLVGHHRAYSPLLIAAERFLTSPQFGRLVAVQGCALFYKPAKYFEEGAWRTKQGGGPILINLIHEIGLLRYFCGEIKSVFAFSSKRVRGFDVEDTVSISFEFVNGVLGTFLLSDAAASNKSWEMTSGENPAYPHYKDQNCYHFAGTNGSLDFPTMTARYYGDGVVPSWWVPFTECKFDAPLKDPLELQLEHFLDVVARRESPKVSALDGYMNMLVLQAITDSINSRAVVDLVE